MKNFDFEKISLILAKIDMEAARKLTKDQMKIIERQVTQKMIIKILPLVKARKSVFNEHLDEINDLGVQIKGWEDYKKNKKIIAEYTRAYTYQYLLNELMKIKKKDTKRRAILMKSFPRKFI